MRILIAVDASPESFQAAETAVKLFGADAEYEVVSVGQRPPVYVGGYVGSTMPDAVDLTRELEAAESAAKDTATRVGERLPGEPTTDVEIGAPGPTICAVAGECGCDVIVIGSHDKSFWERIIDPSVGRYLIEHAPCPVLVVR